MFRPLCLSLRNDEHSVKKKFSKPQSIRHFEAINFYKASIRIQQAEAN